MSITDRDAMAKAIALARQVENRVSPNPYVGAVVVRDGQIVGQGRHRGPGTMHAEIQALGEAGTLAQGADLFTTLEPCCHTGPHKRTPPCVPAVISSGVRRVICATLDPNPEVSGRGVQLLQEAGIEVVVGVCSSEGIELNEGFFTRQTTGLPFVHLKVAQTLDGFLGPKIGPSGSLTDEEIRGKVHSLRAAADAVVVGAGTLRCDDPQLTLRNAPGLQPLRVVLAGRGEIPLDSVLWKDGKGPVLLYLPFGVEAPISTPQVEICRVGEREKGRLDLKEVLSSLAERGVLHVLVEGGSEVASSFLEADLVDKLTVITVPKLAGSGKAALQQKESWPPKDLIRPHVQLIGNQVWHSGYLKEAQPVDLRRTLLQGAFECSRE